MTGKFSNGLGIAYSDYASRLLKKAFWVVEESFVYHIDAERYIYVPAGYLTDGASVPRGLWALIPPWGEYGQACVVHDYLCEYLQIWKGDVRTLITRKDCDQIFLQCMLDLGVSQFKAKTMYRCVRLYAGLASVKYHSFDLAKNKVETQLRDMYHNSKRWF